MKSNCIVNISGILLSFFVLASCREQTAKRLHHTEPVHDSAIASLARPANIAVVSSVPTIRAESGSRIFSYEIDGRVSYDTRQQNLLSARVAGRIERLYIKYNYQPVKKGQLIMEIYSPDLAAAQRDLLYLVEHPDDVMIEKAKQRLRLLGMRDTQINDIIYHKEILYSIPVYSDYEGYIAETQPPSSVRAASPSPASSGNGMGEMNAAELTNPVTPSPSLPTDLLLRQGQYVTKGQRLFMVYHARSLVVEFSLDRKVAAFVKKDANILLHRLTDKSEMQSAKISVVEPVYRSGQSFGIARVYLSKNNFQVGELVRANIPIVAKGGWWLPKKAVWRTGADAIVFRKEGSTYQPKRVETGVEWENAVQVLSDIGDWQIASNASYLVDSESFIYTKDDSNK